MPWAQQRSNRHIDHISNACTTCTYHMWAERLIKGYVYMLWEISQFLNHSHGRPIYFHTSLILSTLIVHEHVPSYSSKILGSPPRLVPIQQPIASTAAYGPESYNPYLRWSERAGRLCKERNGRLWEMFKVFTYAKAG